MPTLARLPRAAAILATCAALVLSACTGKDAVSQGGSSDFQFSTATTTGTVMPAAARRQATNFTGNLLNGGSTSLKANAGKVVVLNFWATWCGPCKVETPQFDLLYRRIKAKGVEFLGIDTKDEKEQARSFVTDNRISYPIVYDEAGETALHLGNIPANLPFTVLLDKRGKVAAVYFGGLTGKDLQPPIDKLLAEA